MGLGFQASAQTWRSEGILPCGLGMSCRHDRPRLRGPENRSNPFFSRSQLRANNFGLKDDCHVLVHNGRKYLADPQIE
jgi:hypothetical protein